MMTIFFDMLGDFLEVFMNDFCAFGSSFDDCLHKLKKVFPHGTVEIQNSTNENTFKVNEQKLKYFVKNIVDEQLIEKINLQEERLLLPVDVKLSACWEAIQFC